MANQRWVLCGVGLVDQFGNYWALKKLGLSLKAQGVKGLMICDLYGLCGPEVI